jgi:cyclopropane fatty-acyl-phospholipid synthase-like methyltransferase
MRAQTSTRLRTFGGRASVQQFDLASDTWYDLLEGADAVVSSLAIHHLNAEGKQQLFKAIAQRVTPRGALLIADLVEPKREEAWELFATGWDRSAEHQSHQPGGSARAYQQFLDAHWNLYRYPDPVDMPSPLFEQLQWLHQAGFATVDCFWLRAAHAIYGGYRSAQRAGAEPLHFKKALEAADRVLTS